MASRHSLIFIPALVICVATALLAGYVYLGEAPRQSVNSEETATPGSGGESWVLQQPRTLAPLRLRDQNDHEFGLEQLRSRWSLLFFGYTHCPDICTPTVARMVEASRLLARDDLQLLFVSVDRGRDDAERLARFLKPFQESQLLGLYGDDEEIRALTLQLGAAFQRETSHTSQPTESEQDKNPPGNYLIEHSSRLYLVDPVGRLGAVLDGAQEAKNLATELRRVLSSLSTTG